MAEKKQNDQNQPQQNQPPANVAGGAADDVSVRAFADQCAQLTKSVLGGDWAGALKSGKSLLSVGLDLIGLGHVFGTSAAGSHGEETAITEAEHDLEECKKHLQGPQVSGASAADPKGIDPATIMMLVEFAMKLLEMFKKRRNP